MRPELIRALDLLQRDDSASFNEAVALLQETVYSFSMKICGHREDAEDNAQEVFVHSFPHLRKIREPKALAVWLYTVARNRCYRMRRKGAHAPRQVLSLDELMPDQAELASLLADQRLNPEAALAREQSAQSLQQAVLDLPPLYRIVLVLHDMEHLDSEMIGQILGVKPGTVRVRLHRARLHVRKNLAARDAKSYIPDESEAKRRPTRSADCRAIFANLSEYLDGHIAPRECEQMREHIAACPPCVAFIRDLRAAIDRCGRFETTCSPDVLNRLRSLLTAEYLRLVGFPENENNSVLV